MQKCTACGYSGIAPLHQHHVSGRKVSDETVLLCPNCHAENHQAILLISNEASRKAQLEFDRIEAVRFLSHRERMSILKRFEYEPRFDGEPSMEDFE